MNALSPKPFAEHFECGEKVGKFIFVRQEMDFLSTFKFCPISTTRST
jgi:hypothetical protein